MQRLIEWHQLRHSDLPPHIKNIPINSDSVNALKQLNNDILSSIETQFGAITITYGFTSNVLKNHLLRHNPGQMAPSLDQHAASELNTKGNLNCKRQGAACDFRVAGFENQMDEIAKFIVSQLPFDRLYFYGKNRPIHVSIGPENSLFVQIMKPSDKGYSVPSLRGVGRECAALFE